MPVRRSNRSPTLRRTTASVAVVAVVAMTVLTACGDSDADESPEGSAAATLAPDDSAVTEPSVATVPADATVPPDATMPPATDAVTSAPSATSGCELVGAGEATTVLGAEFVESSVDDLGADGYFCTFDRADGAAASLVVARIPIGFDVAVQSESELAVDPPTEIAVDGGQGVVFRDEISATLIAERDGVVVSAILDVFEGSVDDQLGELADAMLD
jgi:hypothetical protein